jgi:hypothetical protein
MGRVRVRWIDSQDNQDVSQQRKIDPEAARWHMLEGAENDDRIQRVGAISYTLTKPLRGPETVL